MSQTTHTGASSGSKAKGDAVPKAPLWVIVVKWIGIAIALGLSALAVQRLIEIGWWLGVVIVGAIASAILVVYGRRKGVAMKFVLPGLILLLALQVWPVVYTAATAFTNQGYGNMLTKEEAIETIVLTSVREVPDTPRYGMAVAVEEGAAVETGDLVLLLTDPTTQQVYAGTAEGMAPIDSAGMEFKNNGAVKSAPGYTMLNAKQVNSREDFKDLVVPTERGAIRPQGLSQAFEGVATMVYDDATDTMTDTTTGVRYIEKDGTFVPEDGNGPRLAQGWKINVGFANFAKVLTDPVIRAGFFGIFLWNIAFSVLAVGTTFILGMLLAILFNNPDMKFKRLYRSLLVLPYAIPGFVTALVWKSMLNEEYGLINNTLGLSVNWLGDPVMAKVAVLLTNLWLGFPYMFIVCTGALQSIPSEVYEAAKIDRVGPFGQLTRITMPLLLVSVGPLLISSFSFNFNNFGLIFLLTEGGPFSAGSTQIGSTDLLITYAYRLAFAGANPNYGMAAAVSILIFLLVASISLIGFRKTASLEDVN
ncbi:ABC transporter permease subunit [Tessaracoccus caeni]|uniref:ABC transporter permease subunit n=1 Tax=Tessaracoccus caeni TaxID=3031239 RepID=UPI0023DBB2CD|nr:ABC transporter permease subunit [Tessaracoccus caeni]MDF1487309.1 ABC transporter permease subunit [Tessaracoccus caeni]